MIPLFAVLISFFIYFLGYKFYSSYLSEKIFELKGSEHKTPAHVLNDGIDYVPTKSSILFGHHYASIAGLAPVLGPAVAVIWGWLPAMVWIVLGSLFIGCVHDFSALVVSIRSKGKSIGLVAEELIGKRAKTLFHLIIFFLVSLAMGVFVLVLAGLFSAPSIVEKPKTEIRQDTVDRRHLTIEQYQQIHDQGILKTEQTIQLKSNFPESVLPTLSLMILALIIGFFHYKKGYYLSKLTIASLLLMLVIIYYSMDESFLNFTGLNDPLRSPSIEQWKLILIFYGFIASVTPVWLLLQSRDYINSFLLYAGVGLVYIGFIVGSILGKFPSFNVLAIREESIGLDLIPFVFITIACGSVSGFHALVSSGTTAKQINIEKDARAIGYGGMIGESLLGLTSVVACTVGFSSMEEWNFYYKSWAGLQGLSVQVGAYIHGTSRFMEQIGIPTKIGQGFIALIVISFALTSLDSATRLLRYNLEEMAEAIPNVSFKKIFTNRYVSSFIACLSIAFFAYLKLEVNGQMKPAGLALWKLFGTTNQLLAGLALIVVFIYLYKHNKPVWVVFIPMCFLLIVTFWAMVENLIEFSSGKSPSILLTIVGTALLILAIWLSVESVIVFRKLKNEKTNLS